MPIWWRLVGVSDNHSSWGRTTNRLGFSQGRNGPEQVPNEWTYGVMHGQSNEGSKEADSVVNHVWVIEIAAKERLSRPIENPMSPSPQKKGLWSTLGQHIAKNIPPFPWISLSSPEDETRDNYSIYWYLSLSHHVPELPGFNIRALEGAPVKSRGYPKMDNPFLLFWLRGG
jgi:hypothetical protein